MFIFYFTYLYFTLLNAKIKIKLLKLLILYKLVNYYQKLKILTIPRQHYYQNQFKSPDFQYFQLHLNFE